MGYKALCFKIKNNKNIFKITCNTSMLFFIEYVRVKERKINSARKTETVIL